MSKCGVVGAGYVGLATAVTLTHLGHEVTVAEVNPERLATLRDGRSPILEAGLEERIAQGVADQLLRFVSDSREAATEADFVFLCVQTPMGASGRADLSYLEQAAEEIGPVLAQDAIVITKSTVPVGSSRVVERVIRREGVKVVSSPEFLQEGSAVHDSLHPTRIVLGCDDQAAVAKVATLLEPLGAPMIVTNPASAETIKYAANSFLAMKISFANSVAAVCEGIGANVDDVMLGIGYDPRIGVAFLRPGPGFGGSCLLGEETVLARRGQWAGILTLEEFHDRYQAGSEAWEVLSWRDGDPGPAFLPVSAVTRRAYAGPVLDIRTKMGRRVAVTPDHPFVASDGLDLRPIATKLAGDLTLTDWLPVAIGNVELEPPPGEYSMLEAARAAGLEDRKVIVRLSGDQRAELRRNDMVFDGPRRWDIRRNGTARLSELAIAEVNPQGGLLGTVKNGTYVPTEIPSDEDFWQMVGLYLAEGFVGRDGDRRRIRWCFNHTGEEDLVEFVASYWERLGVKATRDRLPTTHAVTLSSRILAAFFQDVLRLGSNCYEKRIPDQAWAQPMTHKRALLRGLWDGDGSWSLLNRGPSVVFEYGTASRELADGMLRLLGDQGITARLKVGRTPKSTVDNYWLCISGAEQLERCLWLLPGDEAVTVSAYIDTQKKRIRPTGYRATKNASWVRIASIAERDFEGFVYSAEVPGSSTFVTTHGLVVHNCLPKDLGAIKASSEDAGYKFELLDAVQRVNEQQLERIVNKIARHARPLNGSTVAIWGLTFKARTADLRDSPAIEIARRLRERNARVVAYDPTVTQSGPGLEGIDVVTDPYAATEGASALAVLTEWDEFRGLDFEKVASLMKHAAIVDARNLLDAAPLRKLGFEYEGLGR